MNSFFKKKLNYNKFSNFNCLIRFMKSMNLLKNIAFYIKSFSENMNLFKTKDFFNN